MHSCRSARRFSLAVSGCVWERTFDQCLHAPACLQALDGRAPSSPLAHTWSPCFHHYKALQTSKKLFAITWLAITASQVKTGTYKATIDEDETYTCVGACRRARDRMGSMLWMQRACLHLPFPPFSTQPQAFHWCHMQAVRELHHELCS